MKKIVEWILSKLFPIDNQQTYLLIAPDDNIIPACELIKIIKKQTETKPEVEKCSLQFSWYQYLFSFWLK